MLKMRVGNNKDLQKFYGIIAMDYDQKEMLPRLSMHKALIKGDMELLIVSDEESGMDLAYAVTVCRGLYGYVLLKYIGVLPWFREQGLGIQTMRMVNKHYANKQGIIAELTVFDDEEDDSLLKKLRKFFARFGYVKLNADYRLAGSQVELMVKPIQGDGNIEKVAHRIINDFYSRCLSGPALSKMIDIKPVNK